MTLPTDLFLTVRPPKFFKAFKTVHKMGTEFNQETGTHLRFKP